MRLLAFALACSAAVALQTTHVCSADGAWGDTCHYTNVCFSGSPGDLIIFSDHHSDYHVPKGNTGIFAATKMPKRVGGPPNPKRVTPLHYKFQNAPTFISPASVPESGKLGLGEVWIDKPVWIPSYFDDLGNIWYFSSRILPLFTTMVYAEQWGLPPPSLVVLPTSRRKIRHSWHSELLAAALPAGASVFLNEDGPYHGFANKTWCFKQAVLLGANMYGFPDMITGFEFRRQVYARLNLTLPEEPRPHVIILDRPQRKQPRHFVNGDKMTEIVRKYGFEPEYVIITANTTFKQQVELMSRAGVFISMHGAGLMNEIFLPPGSAVIEIFPVHHKHVLYERIAHYAGVYHFKVYAREFEASFHKLHPQYMRRGCDEVNSLSMSDVQRCWSLVKNSNIITPLPEFEVAFVNALDHIGTRTKLRDPTHFEVEALGDRSTPWQRA